MPVLATWHICSMKVTIKTKDGEAKSIFFDRMCQVASTALLHRVGWHTDTKLIAPKGIHLVFLTLSIGGLPLRILLKRNSSAYLFASSRKEAFW
jgi:hypothetical protein